MNSDIFFVSDFMNSFLGNLCENNDTCYYPSWKNGVCILVDKNNSKCSDPNIYEQIAPLLTTYGFYLSDDLEIIEIES